jgi:hypothetical protein
MTTLLETTIARTLDAIVARFAEPQWPGMTVEAWVFEDRAVRREAEAALRARGVNAVIRSAYKPLVHAFLEEIDTAGLAEVVVALPNDPAAAEGRFLVEAYPLAGLLAPVAVRFEAGTAPDYYGVTLRRVDGAEEQVWVFAPNRARPDPVGRMALSPTGWVRAFPPGCPVPSHDAAEVCEFEAAFDAVVAAVKGHGWPAATPFFATMEIEIATGGIERRLPWHDERISTREALHEDLYFSLLELFQQIGGRPLGSRDFQPGQIVPLISAGAGDTRVRVRLVPHRAEVPRGQEPERLELASRPLMAAEIARHLDALGGAAFGTSSVQGRAVAGRLFRGEGPGIVVTAGQHANETSGVVGALRAAGRLVRRGLNLAVLPQENPDGYALHHRLRAENPCHMHHAARFTALGDDLENRAAEAPLERAARLEAFAATDARLHINLHGYPAHEWTRPLTGYLPTGYGAYALPRGFFLILRHKPGLGLQAHAFLQALTAKLIADPGLAALNADQIAAYQAHLGPVSDPIYHGIICEVGENTRMVPPFTLVTEFPDETIYGEAFRLAHTTQMLTVLHAADLLLDDGLLALEVADA